MKWVHVILTASVLLSTAPLTVRANAKPVVLDHENDLTSPHTTDLRSAYLIRAGVVRYDATDRSQLGNRRQLQRHFDVVLGLLLVSTPRSIETALTRLENSTDEHWSSATRSEMRKTLLTMRYLQMRRLAAYRDRGRFPLNESHSKHAIPIFVDDRDSACAVGHLMRLSGWNSEVTLIQNSSNFVYATDIMDGPLAQWVLTSGLTMEEAAWIQPAYGPIFIQPSRPEEAIEVVESKWSGMIDDLRFSNFRILPQMTDESANIHVSHGYCAFFSCHPSGADAPRTLIQFDVETVSPHKLLSSRPRGYRLLTGSGERPYYGSNTFGLFLADDQTKLFLDHPTDRKSVQPVPNYVEFIDLRPFEPTNRLTVIADILTSSQPPHEALRLSFEVLTIPEPSTTALLGLSALIFMRKRRARLRISRLSNST